MGKLVVVVGGQYGSEGKGAIAAYLSHPARFDGTAVRVGGPNAGHTVIDPRSGTPWPLRHIPVAAVVNPRAQLVIAAGSEIDREVLNDEITRLETSGLDLTDRLWLDRSATILTEQHGNIERNVDLTGRVGSTGKGIGAARAARIMRTADTIGTTGDWPYQIEDTTDLLRYTLTRGGDILIEGTQGYGLGLHTANYPQVTSGDCRAIDFLAQAGVNPWQPGVDRFEIWVVIRPHPIRVAGNSGHLYGETTWEALGLPEEKTTVTRRTRRVGAWDGALVGQALAANGHDPSGGFVKVALTMADHIDPAVAGVTRPDQLTAKIHDTISSIRYAYDVQVGLVGTGPDTVVDLRK